jgi:hypothetical protein
MLHPQSALRPVVVVDDINWWPRTARKNLERLRPTVVVTGWMTPALRVLPALRMVRPADFRPAPLCAAPMKPLGRAWDKDGECAIPLWFGMLAERMSTWCSESRGSHADAEEAFRILGLAVGEAARFLSQESHVRAVEAWVWRAAVVSVALARPRKRQTATAGRMISALLGTNTRRLCHRCLGVMTEAHECDWDGQAPRALQQLRRLDLGTIAEVFEDGFSAEQASHARQCLVAACDHPERAPAACRVSTHGDVGRLMLKTWAEALRAHDKLYALDDVFGFVPRSQGTTLFVQGARSFRALRNAWGLPRARCVGWATGGTVQEVPVDAMRDNKPLRLTSAHAKRSCSLFGAVWPLVQGQIRFFLGVTWTVIGGPLMMHRWSFHEDVSRVVLMPSFFVPLCRAPTPLQDARQIWSDREIAYAVQAGSPAARCLALLFQEGM